MEYSERKKIEMTTALNIVKLYNCTHHNVIGIVAQKGELILTGKVHHLISLMPVIDSFSNVMLKDMNTLIVF